MKNFLLVLVLYTSSLFSQDVKPSKTYIQTCYQNQQCFSLNDNSFIFYNPSNHELTITTDMAKFKIGNDTLDEWLNDLDDTKLTFRGLLNTDNLLLLTHHNSKAILVNGQISFNGVIHAHTIEITLFEITREGMLYSDNKNDYFDRINANLQFGFYPKEFKINKKAHHLKKKITLAIYKGYINPYKPEFENTIIK